MSDPFDQILGVSALADYFNVSYLRDNGRGYDLNFLCMKSIAPQLANFFSALGAGFDGWECEQDERYCWIKFDTEFEKDKVDDYFSLFNSNNRKMAMIAMPDLYEGTDTAKPELCDYYLGAIENFLSGDTGSRIAIPFGVSDNDPTIRMFMVYDSSGMLGFYPGPQIFKNSPVGFVA